MQINKHQWSAIQQAYIEMYSKMKQVTLYKCVFTSVNQKVNLDVGNYFIPYELSVLIQYFILWDELPRFYTSNQTHLHLNIQLLMHLK